MILVLSIFSVEAQGLETNLPGTAENGSEEPAASSTNLFEQVNAGLQEVNVVRADFEQSKKLAALERPLTSRGKFIYAKGRGVFWHTTEPFESTLLVTMDAVVEKEAGGETHRIGGREHPEIQGFNKAIMSAFAGESADTRAVFKVRVTGSPEGWVMELKPRNRHMRKAFSRIVVTGSNVVSRLQFLKSDGDSIETIFSNVEKEPPYLTDEEKLLFDE